MLPTARAIAERLLFEDDRASLRGDRYEWRTLLDTLDGGRLYAHVWGTEFCRAGTSRSIYISIPG